MSHHIPLKIEHTTVVGHKPFEEMISEWPCRSSSRCFDGTIIKLKDNAPGFGDPTDPKPLLWTGRKPAQRFRNGLRNLTLDSGTGSAASEAAISNSATLFLRDVKASGYANLVDNSTGTHEGVSGLEVEEYTSHLPSLLFAPAPAGKPHTSKAPISKPPSVATFWGDPP